jgi:6-phosphogluconate dehydrogenase
MKLAMIGLGRMGASMARRLARGGHEVVAFDASAEARRAFSARGVKVVASLAALQKALPAPRTVWLMIPAGAPTDATLAGLARLLARGDTIVDGGNANYKDTQRRAREHARRGVAFVDCGTSGGVWGLANGYSLMVGGGKKAVARLRPLFETLAPARDRGWGRVGGPGAGHFAKMVHNGIEYGLMQAYAEGFSILGRKRDMELDPAQVAGIWRHGSVVRSWLLDLIAAALQANPSMEGIAPHVADSGEGRWTVQEAIDLDVPAPAITLALLQRLRSRDADSFADRLLAAMRQQFGGHPVRPATQGRRKARAASRASR